MVHCSSVLSVTVGEDAKNHGSGWHHRAMSACLDGLYPCKETIQAILSPNTGGTKRILDIGELYSSENI